VIAVAFLAVPAVAGIPGRLIEGCGRWIGLAVALEALSVVGFVLVFKLIFGPRMRWRQASASGLRALGASSLLPAGNMIGPAIGARSGGEDDTPLAGLARSTIALTVITLVPGVIVLGTLSLALWLGLVDGPHDARLMLPAAGFTLAFVAAVAQIRRPSTPRDPRSDEAGRLRRSARLLAAALRPVADGVVEARCMLVGRDWKLLGAVAYYAFDNAVLWAAFHAYGHTPAPSVIVMGYLVGSLGAALPTPAGLGAVEGGLIGALVLYGAPAGPAAGAVLLYRGVSLLLPVALSACAWALLPLARLRLQAADRRARRWGPRDDDRLTCAIGAGLRPARPRTCRDSQARWLRGPHPASVVPTASEQLIGEFLTDVPASRAPAVLADRVEHVVDVALFDLGCGLRAAAVDLTVSPVPACLSLIDGPPHMRDQQHDGCDRPGQPRDDEDEHRSIYSSSS
jgi:uncharacterized membrane protein YbhN (UPF0104 family)